MRGMHVTESSKFHNLHLIYIKRTFVWVCMLKGYFFSSLAMTLIKCYHMVKMSIKKACHGVGADEFHKNYIRPVVREIGKVAININDLLFFKLMITI